MTAADYLPEHLTLDALREAAELCHGCDLWRNASQTVFGEGPADAELMFVGEQPGDQEDRLGQPFVGPAGGIFDKALEEVGIDRSRVYVTNAVKHFKWESRGKRRIHQKPNAGELAACRPWLDAELAVLEPRVLVCLGATAAQGSARPHVPRHQAARNPSRLTARRGRHCHDPPVRDPPRPGPRRGVRRLRCRPPEGRRAALARGRRRFGAGRLRQILDVVSTLSRTHALIQIVADADVPTRGFGVNALASPADEPEHTLAQLGAAPSVGQVEQRRPERREPEELHP